MMKNFKVYVDPELDDKTKSLLMGYKGNSSIGPESYVIQLDGTFMHYGAPVGCSCGNAHPNTVEE